MAPPPPPPELRVLCRRLAANTSSTASADDLLGVCPSLVSHVLRCGCTLSTVSSHDQKKGAGLGGDETAILVHRLKTHMNTLLNGKTPASRFAGMVLVKAVVDVGGWECLRGAEPWVRGLLSILQKPDPISSKELCVVTLTRIYTLLQQYPTLVREIATPTVPAFVTSCLQLLKPPLPGKAPRVTTAMMETLLSALATIVPLYPTTTRPFNTQIKAAIRPYLAPTSSSGAGASAANAAVPHSLRRCARRLAVNLHHTAPKSTHAEEWASFLGGLVGDCHATADQVFRAVQEVWEPSSSSGYTSRSSNSKNGVLLEGEPRGGGDDSEELLPAWSGVLPGAQRLVGLLETVSECLRTPTRSSVSLPVGTLTDLASRILLVTPPPSSSPSPSGGSAQDRDHAVAMQPNPSVGRDERDELWSALPDVHVAVARLLNCLLLRLGRNALPFAPDVLGEAIRLLVGSGDHRGLQPDEARQAAFALIREALLICGPTLPKIAVDSLAPVVQSCCRDVLGAAGFLEPEKSPPQQQGPATTRNGMKQVNGSAGAGVHANADLFLPPATTSTSNEASSARRQPNSSSTTTLRLTPAHLAAAEALLEVLISHVPQHHLKKADRALLDRTAILSRNRAALVAGVLHPYRDGSGRLFANTVPFLARQFPLDPEVEVLRTALRTAPHYFGNVFASGDADRGEAREHSGDVVEDAVGQDVKVSVITAIRQEEELLQVTTGRDGGGFARHFDASTRMEVDGGSSGTRDEILIPKERNGGADSDAAPPFVPLTLKRKSMEVDDEGAEPLISPKRQDKGKALETTAAPFGSHEEIKVGIGMADGGDGSDSDDESVHLQMVLDDDGDDEEDETDQSE